MKTYTMKQWQKDKYFNAEVGQVCDSDVMEQLINAVPPRTYSNGIFQVGEPFSHDFNTGKALYMTFESVGNYEYKYIGLKH